MENLVILITGASSGIGKDAARRLLKEGHTVYAAARRVERMEDIRTEGAHIIKMDVCDDASMIEGVNTIISEQGRIDILINNAGYGSFGTLENVDLSEARRQFDVNVFGLARLCQLVIPHMRERHSGRIINVASMAGHFGEPRGDWYHSTKYAVVGLSECLRMELKEFGIKVILIEPGAIRSDWSNIAMDHLEESSKGTVYEKGAMKQSRIFRWAFDHFSSDPKVVTRGIYRACTSRCPRIRYRMGFGSGVLSLSEVLVPQRLFDYFATKIF